MGDGWETRRSRGKNFDWLILKCASPGKVNKIQIDSYAKMITDSFDVLYRECAETGRLMVLIFHPWIMGTPFRSKYLEIALRHISKHDGIWNASASEIVDWHRSQTAK